MTAAVAYVRMSSDKQEASPKQQREEITKLAKREGYRIIHWYTDEAVSGDATEKRFQFQEMIRDANSGKFKAILAWDQDRFGRFDSIEAGHWIYPLRKAGVCLVTVAQGRIDWSDITSRIIYGVQQEAKHAYLRDLSRNVTRGLIARAKRGEWVQGNRPPFGYALDNGRLVLASSCYVKLVRRIFREYLADTSLQELTSRLNEGGVMSPSGGVWYRSTVRAVLTNVRYTGTFIWNVRSSSKYYCVRNGEVSEAPRAGKNEPGDWIVLENNHPAIIERRTFDAAQRRLLARRSKKRSSASSPRPDRYVMTGLVHCEKCGSRMVGHSVKGHQYLICSGHLDKGASFCDRNTVRQDELVRHVVAALEERFLDPAMVEEQRAEILADTRRSVQPGTRTKLRRQLGVQDEKLAKAKRRLVEVDLDMVSVVQQRIRDLQERQTQLKHQLSQATVPKKRRLSEANQKFEAALSLFSRLQQSLIRSDFKTLRDCLEKTIDKIVVKVSKTKQGRRHRYQLLGGEIYPQVSSLYCSPSCAHM